MMKYLKNVGQPAKKEIYLQRFENWYFSAKDKTRKIVEIVCPEGTRESMGDEEIIKAKELGLKPFEKAILFYEDDGRIIPEIYSRGSIYKKEIRDIGYSFSVDNYPHLVGVVCSEQGQFGEKRKYTILAGDRAEVSNTRDFQFLQKTYLFLDECDERGNVIQKNPYYLKTDNHPVDKSNVSLGNLGTLGENQIPRQSKEKTVALEENKEISTKE
jgi:hypothetical protein